MGRFILAGLKGSDSTCTKGLEEECHGRHCMVHMSARNSCKQCCREVLALKQGHILQLAADALVPACIDRLSAGITCSTPLV